MQTDKQLKQTIMRRVYYAYGISLATNPALLHGIALSVSLALLFQAIYVRAIIHNFFATPVGSVPSYVWHSFTGAETFVLALIGVITFVLLSFSFTFKQGRFTRMMQTA